MQAIFPHFWHPLRNAITTASQYLVLAISVERYVVICYKMGGSIKPQFYTGGVIVFSVFVNMPKFFEFQLLHQKVQQQNNSTSGIEETVISYWTSRLGEDTSFVLFNAWHEIAVTGFCLIAICVCNFQVCIQIRRSSTMKDR